MTADIKLSKNVRPAKEHIDGPTSLIKLQGDETYLGHIGHSGFTCSYHNVERKQLEAKGDVEQLKISNCIACTTSSVPQYIKAI